MESTQKQVTNTETTAPLSEQHTSHKPETKSEPITQVQADNVLTREQLPSSKFRIGLNLFFLAIFLFVTALFFGIINP